MKHSWHQEFPWHTGSLGDPMAPIWFVGENPSVKPMREIHERTPPAQRTPDLQWNSSPGDKLLRKALIETGLLAAGHCCFITNAVKEPMVVKERNAAKSAGI